MDSFSTLLTDFKTLIENYFGSVPKWQLILGSVSFTAALLSILDIVNNREDYFELFKENLIRKMKNAPFIRETIESEMQRSRTAVREMMYEPEEKEITSFLQLAEEGKSKEQVLELAKEIFRLGKYEWQNGRVSGGVQTGTDLGYNEMMKELYRLCVWTDPLHSNIFPGIRKMEAEVVRMTANIFSGGEDTVGCMTSGGSESLILAMKAYRDWARDSKGIKRPEVVAAYTVHAAVDKGARMLGYKLKKVQIDAKTGKADLTEVSKAITSNTVLLVASAPEYSHGIIDDIEAFSELAVRRGIALHVDCCLGGFVLPFMDAAGYSLPPFDFRLPGVTSISADPHKYGNCPKGASVVLYSKKEYIHYQYFVTPDRPGEIFATPTIPGSRAGGNISTCWAAMLYYGMDGYVNLTRSIIATARRLKEGIRKIPGLFLFGDPLSSVVAFGGEDINIFQVADVMAESGWHLQPLQNPPGIHMFLTSLHVKKGIIDELLADLEEAVNRARKIPGEADSGIARLYGMASSLPHKSFVTDAAKMYLDVYYTPSAYE